MKTANYLYPTRQNGAWKIFFAHRLVSIAATDLVREDEYREFVARILRAHADFLNSLAYARDERTFELRYISQPHPHVPDKGQIDIAFVGKVEHPQRREAVRRCQAFCEDTWMLLTTSFEEYEFARIENRDDFTALFRPMNYTHMAELLRREDCIPLEAIGHPRRVNLAKGKLGEINLNLLGMLIVAKLQSAAMSRTDLPAEERKDFYLYVDEFQNIATESFAAILSEARKYRLNLVVTNQYIAQVPREISQAVFGNVGAMIAFRVGMGDAEMLEERFVPVFGSRDLINLPNFNAYVSMLVEGQVVRQFSMRSLPDETPEDDALANRIIDQSRERYSQLREQVDRQVVQQFGEDAGTALDESEIASLLSDSMATEE